MEPFGTSEIFAAATFFHSARSNMKKEPTEKKNISSEKPNLDKKHRSPKTPQKKHVPEKTISDKKHSPTEKTYADKKYSPTEKLRNLFGSHQNLHQKCTIIIIFYCNLIYLM